MLLELVDIGKRYGTRTVFRGVNLALYQGSVVLLAGSNGAGKSTLLRVLAGLSAPSTGSLRMQALRPDKVAYLGHIPSIYPALSALENLRFWQRVRESSVDDSELENLLERVGLGRHAADKAGAFSRGMLQRLNLARVLAQKASLLLLDEPATGLDTASTQLLRREIAAAREQGACVLWISHSISQDMPYADRVLVLDKQRLVFDGSVAEYERVLPTLNTVSPGCASAGGA